MDANFWHERWKHKQIGFHEGRPNTGLVKSLGVLNLNSDATVFVPLCGKAVDMEWLLSKGYKVIGVELSEKAIVELFANLGCTAEITKCGSLKRYRAKHIEIYVGDIFDVKAEMLGKVAAVYDRAALVALPELMRKEYADHLSLISNFAPQLLLCFEYDQYLMDGPPFSIDKNQIKTLYGDKYEIEKLEVNEVIGGLRKTIQALEVVWLLRKR